MWGFLLVVLLVLRSSTNVNTHEIFASDRFEKAHRDLSTGSILAFSFSAPSAVIPTDTAVEAEGGDGDSTGADGEDNKEEDEDEDEDPSLAEKNNSDFDSKVSE